MKKKILLFLMSIILISCGRTKEEKKLYGNWYDINEKINIEIDEDSIKIFDNDFQKNKWNVSNKKLHFDYKPYLSDTIIKLSKGFAFTENDTLVMDGPNGPSTSFKFIRSKNYLDFLSKKHQVIFDLKEYKNAKYNSRKEKLGLKVFIGYRNDTIICKTEFSENLDNLDKDWEEKLDFNLEDFYINYSDATHIVDFEKWQQIAPYYKVFVDKNIPQDSVKKCFEKMKNQKPFKIYMVSKTKENNYIDFTNMKMIEID
ncbi:hypothetical protein [Aureivirga sp. CE67]|uniref:hypothetical protein n=1 Tax=Aureivirga sp. CE67 TaxID=1788983 RepID=UPI0018C9D4E6|nr:hypothetical protein [Aureivirga sp. CE67]